MIFFFFFKRHYLLKGKVLRKKTVKTRSSWHYVLTSGGRSQASVQVVSIEPVTAGTTLVLQEAPKTRAHEFRDDFPSSLSDIIAVHTCTRTIPTVVDV